MMPLTARAPGNAPPISHDPQPTGPIRFEFLTVLRGLAVVGILIFHTNALFIPFGKWIYNAILYLHLGLPVFFLISGFCMMASVDQFRQQGYSSTIFIWHRLSRIYPPLWLAMGLSLLLPLFKNLCLGLQEPFAAANIPYARLSAGEWFSFVTLLQVYFSHGQPLIEAFRPINPVYWSLAIEVQFYAIVFLQMTFPRQARLIIGSVTLLGLGASLIPKAYNTGSFLPYWPSFALGMGLYAVLKRDWAPDKVLPPRLAAAAPLLAVSLLLLYLNRVGYDIGNKPQIFGFLVTVCLWSIFPWDSRMAILRKHPSWAVAGAARLLFLIGASSYSIYLLHIPLADLLDTIFSHFLQRNASYAVLVLVATCILAYSFYLICERPFVSAGKPKKREAPR